MFARILILCVAVIGGACAAVTPIQVQNATTGRTQNAQAGDVANTPGTVGLTEVLDNGIAAPALSAAGTGTIYFDSTANVFRASQNGGAYTNLIGGGAGGWPVSTSTYAVQDTSDATKQQLWNLASMGTGTILTLKGQQTTSQTLGFPNLTAADTVATLGVFNNFNSGQLEVSGSSFIAVTLNAASGSNPNDILFEHGGSITSEISESSSALFQFSDGIHSNGWMTYTPGSSSAATVSFPDTTASTTTTNGAVTVAGGEGIAGNLNVGGESKTSASTTTRAGLNAAPGVAPTSPANGDIWDTSAGFFVQVNGGTVGPLTSYTNPMTTLGDIIYGGASGVQTRLAGNTTTTPMVYQQVGTGSSAAAPTLAPLTAAMIPPLPASIISTGILGNAFGGLGYNASGAANGSVPIGTGTGVTQGVPTATPPLIATTGAGTLNYSLGTVGVANGGSGQTSYTTNLLLASGTTSTSAFQTIANGAAGQVLTANASGLPTFQPASGGVASLNSLTGALNVVAGSGITVTPSGSNITIAATGGGGGGTTFADNVFAVQNASDATKQLEFSLGGMTSGQVLTMVSSQSASANLTVPNITSAGDTLATLKQGNAYSGSNTFGTSATPVAITEGAASSGAPPTGFSYAGGAHTGLTAGTATPAEVLFNGGQTKQWTGGTTVTNYRFFEVDQPTTSATSATTFVSPTTFWINGAPTAGANATNSATYAFKVAGGNSFFGGQVQTGAAGQNLLIQQSSTSTAATNIIQVSGGAQTNVGAGNEVTDILFNLSHTVQHATGALTNQRAVYVQAPTYTFVGASTITTADTVNISGAPIAGTNATITTTNALHVAGGRSQFDGDVSLGVIGARLKITTGSNASAGTATLASGAVTVSNTLVTANTMVFVTCQALGTVAVASGFSITRTAGTSFTITASAPTDTSTVAWFFVEPGP